VSLIPISAECDSTSAVTNDEQYLHEAYDIIDAIMETLTVDGGLRELCETDTRNACNEDQQAFKGITMFFLSVSYTSSLLVI
jgi:NH3-dependent NAD+ synthetase